MPDCILIDVERHLHPRAVMLGAFGALAQETIWRICAAHGEGHRVGIHYWNAGTLCEWNLLPKSVANLDRMATGMRRAEAVPVFHVRGNELRLVEGLGIKLPRPRLDRVREAILRRDHYTCQYCGSGPLPPDLLHVDHVQPVSRGGTSAPENLLVACCACNLNKNNKLLWLEWVPPNPTTKVPRLAP